MGPTLRLAAILLAASLSACSTYTPPPIGPDEPVAELTGTGDFSMSMPFVDKKGCYQGNFFVDTKPAAAPSKVRVDSSLVVVIDGSVGIARCHDTVKFRPVAGHKYVAHGLPGRDESEPPKSIFRLAASANKEHCHVEIFDVTDAASPVRVKVERREPRPAGIACIRF